METMQPSALRIDSSSGSAGLANGCGVGGGGAGGEGGSGGMSGSGVADSASPRTLLDQRPTTIPAAACVSPPLGGSGEFLHTNIKMKSRDHSFSPPILLCQGYLVNNCCVRFFSSFCDIFCFHHIFYPRTCGTQRNAEHPQLILLSMET